MSDSDFIVVDTIETDFVPTVSADIRAWSVGGEAVLVNSRSGSVHALNPIAALVWQCFDGQATLGEIVADLAEGFCESVDVVRSDVLTMARAAAKAGLLQGVEYEPLIVAQSPAGIPEGELVHLPAGHRSEKDYNNRRTLLVHWSATCGFCERILPELAAVYEALEKSGVEIMLVDTSDGATTKAQLSHHELDIPVVSGEDAISLVNDAFRGMGTPVAYMLDAQSQVESPLAYGAPNVVELARSAAVAAQEPDAGAANVPKFLPVAGGVCAPGIASGGSRKWREIRAYEVADYRIGIRANSESTERTLEEVFASHRLPDDVRAPDNFSVLLHDGAGERTRDVNRLLSGSATLARSRSPQRVLAALANHMSCVLDPDPGLVRLDAVGATFHGDGVLLPKAIHSWLDRVQASLARLGFALVDQPYAHIDPSSRELVVTAPRLAIDEAAMNRLDEGHSALSEPPPVPIGRYPLRSWLMASPKGITSGLSPAEAVSGALGSLVVGPAELAGSVEVMVALMERVDAVAVPCDNFVAFRDIVTTWARTVL